MPAFLQLASGGLLGLAGQGALQLASPIDPVAPSDSVLYELDRFEGAFKSILQTQLPGVQICIKRETITAKSPRVELIFTAQQNEGRRYPRFTDNSFAPAQPLNTWNYTLQLTTVTNRNNSESGYSHEQIVGVVRWSMQYYRLLATITDEILPYHAITSIWESEAQEDTLTDQDDLDMTRLTFGGVCNIKDTAWPAL